MDNNEVVTCAFCGNRRIPEITFSGMMTPLTQNFPLAEDNFGREVRIVIDVLPPVICFDCVLKFASKIEEQEHANVDLPLSDGSRILFDGDRWYIIDQKGTKDEVLRSYAIAVIMENNFQRKVSKKAWQDVCSPDQPLAATEEKAKE